MAIEPNHATTRGRRSTAGTPSTGALLVAASAAVLALAGAALVVTHPALAAGVAAGLLAGPVLRIGRRAAGGRDDSRKSRQAPTPTGDETTTRERIPAGRSRPGTNPAGTAGRGHVRAVPGVRCGPGVDGAAG